MHSNVVTTHGDGIVVNHHTLDHFVVCNKNIKMTRDITFAQLPIFHLTHHQIFLLNPQLNPSLLLATH